MADRVYAAMDGVQSPRLDPRVDRTSPKPGLKELTPCQDAVLARRDLRDCSFANSLTLLG
jgi:hypothetical protein